MGLEGFLAEVERRLGYKLQPARPFNFTSNIDEFGWVTGEDGRHHYTTFIENGRVQDEPEKNFKTGLQEIAKVHKGDFKLTANQHIMISNVADEELPRIKRLLAEYKLDNVNHSGLRLSSSACVAFPTCGMSYSSLNPHQPVLTPTLLYPGLAMAESERVCNILFHLILTPDIHSVLARVDRESREDMRREWAAERFYRDADDGVSQRLC